MKFKAAALRLPRFINVSKGLGGLKEEAAAALQAPRPMTRTSINLKMGLPSQIKDDSRGATILCINDSQRFTSFDMKSWRASYNSMIVLEHLSSNHGPESVAKEFEDDIDVIKKTGSFQHVDEKGFNWGLTVKNKAERIVKLLENRALLKEERNRARTVTRGIEGFGSFKISNHGGILQDLSKKTYKKSISHFNYHIDEEEDKIQISPKKKVEERLVSVNSFHSHIKSFKENITPPAPAPAEKKAIYEDDDDDFEEWNSKLETNRLLGDDSTDSKANVISGDDDHPFNHSENLSGVSLLSSKDHTLQAC